MPRERDGRKPIAPKAIPPLPATVGAINSPSAVRPYVNPGEQRIGGLEIPQMPTEISSGQPAEFKDILARRKSALEGFQAPELAALRSQMALQRQGAEQGRSRQLAAQLSRSNVRGGAAAAAQGRAQQLAAQERNKQSQDLFLANVAQKQKALGEYEGTAGDALKRTQGYDLARLAAGLTTRGQDIQKEIADKQGKVAIQTGLMGMGASLQNEDYQRDQFEDLKRKMAAGQW